MMQKNIEQYFDIAFSAPDGIKRLRKMILTLAMQGKLVEQDPSDEPTSELLKKIAAERKNLETEGKLKKQNPLPPITEKEIPYALPKGWEWVRLGEIANYNGRKNIDTDGLSDNVWLLDLEDIEKQSSRLLYRATYGERLSKSTKSIFCKGDVLYGKLRPYLDKVIVADSDGVCTTEIVPIVLLGNINPFFLRLLLKRPSFLTYVDSLMYGIKMPRLGTEDAIYSIHPLPPISEQYRIVVRVEELMTRCDVLEALRDAHEEKRQSVHQAVITSLTTTGEQNTSEAFTKNWHFLAKDFSELHANKVAVAELRKAILQLAMQGKLVPQDPNNVPANELLKKIAAERRKLEAEGKIKKQKPLLPITEKEMPYVLPQSWEWVRIADVALHNSGKTLDSGRNTGILRDYITTSNLYWGHFKLDSIKRMPIQDKELEKCTAHKNDLLICEGGEAGRAAVWPYEETICFQNHIHRIRFQGEINPYFVFRFFEKINATKEINNYRKGVAISNMSSKTLASILLPLPPLAEQCRIVAKVDQLMTLCDELEKEIETRSLTQTKLLDAIMAQI